MSHEKERSKKLPKGTNKGEKPLSVEQKYTRIRELAGEFAGALRTIPAYQAEPEVGFCDIYLQNEFIGKHIQFTHGKYDWEIEVSSWQHPSVVEQKSIYIYRRRQNDVERPTPVMEWTSELDEHATLEYTQQSKPWQPRSSHIEYVSCSMEDTLYKYEKAEQPLKRILNSLQKAV